MDRDEVLKMAREAGFDTSNGWRDDGSASSYLEAWPEQVERFASLVRNQALEEAGVRLDQMAAEDNTSNYYVIAARRVRALKTEEVRLTARSGLPPTGEPHELNCICGATWEIGTDGSEMLVAAPRKSQSGAKKQDHPESGGSISAIGRDASKENGNGI